MGLWAWLKAQFGPTPTAQQQAVLDAEATVEAQAVAAAPQPTPGTRYVTYWAATGQLQREGDVPLGTDGLDPAWLPDLVVDAALPVLPGQAWDASAKAFVSPPSAAPAPRIVTPTSFMRRIGAFGPTLMQRVASDPQLAWLQLWLLKTPVVDLDDPQTVAGAGYIASIGGPAASVLLADPQPGEA